MTSPAPSTSSWLPWVQPSVQAMPLTTDPAFIGHQFRHDGTRYTIHRKTANKRGGTSWIWRWGTEIRKEGAAASQKVGWLCCICWDKKVIYPVGTLAGLRNTLFLRSQRSKNSTTHNIGLKMHSQKRRKRKITLTLLWMSNSTLRLVINRSTILRRTVELWEGLRRCSTSGATTVSICLRFNMLEIDDSLMKR